MKTFKSFFCIVTCLLGITPIHAQIKVTQEGYVKIGKQRQVEGMTLPWSNSGLEVNNGDIVFYASNGAALSFKSYTSKNKSSMITPGNPGLGPTTPSAYSLLYGIGLKVGSAESLIWELNTTNLYAKYTQESGSDRRMKRNIQPIVDAKQYVLNLQPVTYDLIPEEDFIGDSAKLLNKAGFIAQDVLEVLPGAVGYMEEVDRYTLSYNHFIPYLTQTIQEQEQEIQTLKDQLSSLQEIVQSLLVQNSNVNASPRNNAPKNNPQNAIQEAKLFQNLPNPFSERTIIRYELPKTAGNAYLQVFDMSGRMLQNIQLPHQEIGQVEISAGELTPGAYTYSLVVSGKVVDSKRMVVTQ